MTWSRSAAALLRSISLPVPAAMAAPTLTQIDRTSMTHQQAAAPANGGSAITSYDARYSTDQATWTVVTGIASPATVTGLTAGTGYYQQTRAVSANGAGPWSPSKWLQTVFDYSLYNEAGSTTIVAADLVGMLISISGTYTTPLLAGITVAQDVNGELYFTGFSSALIASQCTQAGVKFEQLGAEAYAAPDLVVTANTTGNTIKGLHYLELIAGTARTIQNTPQPGFPVMPTRELFPVTG